MEERKLDKEHIDLAKHEAGKARTSIMGIKAELDDKVEKTS